jgi:hypothetical protein
MHYVRWRKRGTTDDPVERTCAIEGCDEKHYGHGYCQNHYSRWRKHGDPLIGARVERPATCTVEDCKRKHKGYGYCQGHLRQAKAAGELGETRPCTVEGCKRTDYYANGLCELHYQRSRKHGDPLGLTPVRPNEERFFENIERDPTSGCWNWTGRRRSQRYGLLHIHLTEERGAYGSGAKLQKAVAAHRWAYERWRGPIPYGFHVHHTCRNPLCANPDHLEVLSAGDHWRLTGARDRAGVGPA